jgi:DNA polymerase-3 subunit epsilon
MTTFAAIDFETANYRADSACAVGLVVVKGSRIVQREHYLIRPPDREFVFTYLHGITWDDVRDAPTFAELWPILRELITDVDFLAAHNASFDQ